MKPNRIILVRHGQSEGNVNKTIYSQKEDWAINLTDTGREQARIAGRHIHCLGVERARFYLSPYYRARQTAEEIGQIVTPIFKKEDPRLREQEWTTRLEREDLEKERSQFSRFYYRFEHGESGADVYDRISTFLETLYRDFNAENCPKNVIIVGHGFTNRIFSYAIFPLDAGGV